MPESAMVSYARVRRTLVLLIIFSDKPCQCRSDRNKHADI